MKSPKPPRVRCLGLVSGGAQSLASDGTGAIQGQSMLNGLTPLGHAIKDQK